jgi:hypothetical protein
LVAPRRRGARPLRLGPGDRGRWWEPSARHVRSHPDPCCWRMGRCNPSSPRAAW